MKKELWGIVRVAGVTFENRQRVVSGLKSEELVKLVREQKNIHDPNAIGVFNCYQEQIGYIPREQASQLTFLIDQGHKFEAAVNKVEGGGVYKGKRFHLGVEIIIREIKKR